METKDVTLFKVLKNFGMFFLVADVSAYAMDAERIFFLLLCQQESPLVCFFDDQNFGKIG